MKKQTRIVLVSYLVFIHAALAAIVWHDQVIPRVLVKLTGQVAAASQNTFFDRMVEYHKRSDGALPDGCGIFIGDSLIQGMSVDAVCDRAVNYGIGSDTIDGVVERLPKYESSIRRAKFVFLAIGINDLAKKSDDAIVEGIIAIVGNITTQQVFVSSLLPVNTELDPAMVGFTDRISRINSKLSAAQSQANFVFVDATPSLDSDGDGRLDNDKCIADGLHLNAVGNKIWSKLLRSAIPSSDQ
jgi:lysophospholipase L1-like esterase